MTPTSPPSHSDPSPNRAGLAGEVVVGLDIGGSKTHGVLWRNGELVGEAQSGSANTQNVSADEAAAQLHDLFAALGGRGGLQQVDRVVAGAGGVDTPDDAERLRALIEPCTPTATIDVVHDTRLILAAGGARTGIGVIAGTGSVAWGIDASGREARSGGWGYLLGDEGSGYWLVRAAVRRALHRHDLGAQPDSLDEAILALNGARTPTELIGLFHSDAGRTYWAAQSPAVFDAARAGHPGASALLDQAAADLTGLVQDVVSVLDIPGPVVLGGGLAMHQVDLQERLRPRLEQAGVTEIVFLDRDPVLGALFLANSAA